MALGAAATPMGAENWLRAALRLQVRGKKMERMRGQSAVGLDPGRNFPLLVVRVCHHN